MISRELELSPRDEKVIEDRVRQLEKRLQDVDPELVNLEIAVEAQPRRTEYTGQVRLVVMNHVLPARRNRAKQLNTFLNRAFDDIEEQLDDFTSSLRSESHWKRKRGARSEQEMQEIESELVEERALLDSALAGNSEAFALAAEKRLAGLRKVIFDHLDTQGKGTSDADLDAALSLVLSRAAEDLKKKPEHWPLRRWLAWVAARELANGSRE
ncbi:MAG TPA: hypothetical protein VFO52_11935 [Longimicrobiales bacterium]|nr:hypothetical protein [Longimicrobiales bacterium]